jgi:hypothetical protein
MKANELRIGNIVGCDIQSVTVKAINDETCVCHNGSGKPYVLHLEDLFGLKLTEEWLLKFGFTSNPYADCYDFNGIKIECDKTRGRLELWCSNITGKIMYLTSVHQLQNLYFALTGEELIIKE